MCSKEAGSELVTAVVTPQRFMDVRGSCWWGSHAYTADHPDSLRHNNCAVQATSSSALWGRACWACPTPFRGLDCSKGASSCSSWQASTCTA